MNMAKPVCSYAPFLPGKFSSDRGSPVPAEDAPDQFRGHGDFAGQFLRGGARIFDFPPRPIGWPGVWGGGVWGPLAMADVRLSQPGRGQNWAAPRSCS